MTAHEPCGGFSSVVFLESMATIAEFPSVKLQNGDVDSFPFFIYSVGTESGRN